MEAMLVAEEKESTQGASSSSSFPPKPIDGANDQYDVFLSFNDSDTPKEFMDRLYHSLNDAGICVFMDCNSTRIGEEFSPVLLNAITCSKISTPIISQHYALSKWCLRELTHIMVIANLVEPIFYEVDPSDVRCLKGSFGEAFDLCKHHFDEKEKQALKDVCCIRGPATKRYPSRYFVIDYFVDTIREHLRKCYRPFVPVPKELVGLDGQLKKIMSRIDGPSVNARMIGIYGMGGIGKTTLAECIYNQLLNKFDHVCFLPSIQECNMRCDINHLQKKLIYNILKEIIAVPTVDLGINIIKSRFTGKKVLIVLDDIDHKDQLDALAGEGCWFASGSIIIVTTRNKAILDQSNFKIDYEHEMSEMDEGHSFILFNKYAFGNPHPPSELASISRQITSIADGLPLALRILGSGLKDLHRESWDYILEELNESPLDLQDVLEISYDALEDEHKEIFLDIACSFIGKRRKFAMYMSDNHGYASQGIKELKLRSLAKIEDDGKLSMHYQLRGLGKDIIRTGRGPESRTYSGLWIDEEAFRVLTEKKETTIMEAICHIEYSDHPFLDYGPADHPRTYMNEQFEKLQRLRFVRLRNSTSSEDFDKLFSEVRWIQWFCIQSNLSFCSTKLHLPKLVVLQLSYSSITEDWKGWSSITTAKQLKVLHLENFDLLRCSPDLSVFLELKILILRNCCNLKQVHPSIGKLKSLVCLDLNNCRRLKKLPGEVGELEELKELIFDSPVIIEIPKSIGSLRKLEKLSARHCKSLREIPYSIGELQNLEHMDMSHSAIERLPCAIGRLKKLRSLSLRYCHNLKGEIPREIGDLSSLEILEITEARVIDMPESIQNLSSLQHLDLWGCCNLPSLLELPSSLKYLRASFQGPRLPELSHLIHLEKLDLSWKQSTLIHPGASETLCCLN
ncbi:hypothetical protein BT93_G0692 [Corymbia citriodora subsp. variegata]|nr:hypothetical protein BT93_G0692 [Corymbia citriodora subsp. variegata]